MTRPSNPSILLLVMILLAFLVALPGLAEAKGSCQQGDRHREGLGEEFPDSQSQLVSDFSIPTAGSGGHLPSESGGKPPALVGKSCVRSLALPFVRRDRRTSMRWTR